ncbi:MAG TPA: SDR family oxidoreductase [Gaiellaceae bacterium]|nr:SDR family oxidoreductase [Gaiellaceae bacterium]
MSRVVVVTGASAGIGRAVARSFARRGDAVALIARESGRLDDACLELEALGAQALALPADVADADAVEDAAERTEAALGPIDVWVNNAMVTMLAPVERVTPAEFRRVTEVTYLGSVWGTMAALRRMRPRDRGVVVQVGSTLAYRGIPLQAAYCGAKHALQGFYESLRTELMHDGSAVRVTMVHMPAVNTPQFEWMRTRMERRPRPIAPVYTPELAADAVVAAAEAPRADVVIGWPSLLAPAANAIVPGVVDRYLAATGYDAQQDGDELEPERPDNLFEPVPLDVRAEGRFGEEAHRHAIRLPAAVARGVLGATAMAALAGLAAAASRANRKPG